MADAIPLKRLPASGDPTSIAEFTATDTTGVADGGTGSTTASGARTNLGLGTAAVENVGTSGDTVPKNNTANVYSQIQDFSTAGVYLGTAAAANLLDDYEEGTWTPVLSDGTNDATHTSQLGRYTKIGNKVYVSGFVLLSSKGSVSGNLRVTGLPFAAIGTNPVEAISIATTGALNLAASGQSMIMYAGAGTTNLNLRTWDGVVGATPTQDTEITNTTSLHFSGFYQVA